MPSSNKGHCKIALKSNLRTIGSVVLLPTWMIIAFGAIKSTKMHFLRNGTSYLFILIKRIPDGFCAKNWSPDFDLRPVMQNFFDALNWGKNMWHFFDVWATWIVWLISIELKIVPFYLNWIGLDKIFLARYFGWYLTPSCGNQLTDFYKTPLQTSTQT